jgi:hypothetical protein
MRNELGSDVEGRGERSTSIPVKRGLVVSTVPEKREREGTGKNDERNLCPVEGDGEESETRVHPEERVDCKRKHDGIGRGETRRDRERSVEVGDKTPTTIEAHPSDCSERSR